MTNPKDSCVLPDNGLTFQTPSRVFAKLTNDGILIDWEETERQRDSNIYAKLLLAIRDGTWRPFTQEQD